MIITDITPDMANFHRICTQIDQIQPQETWPADAQACVSQIKILFKGTIQKQHDQMAILKRHIQDQQSDIDAITADNNDLHQANADLEESNQQLLADNEYLQRQVEESQEKDSRARRLSSNKEISPAHKIVLMHIEDKVSQMRPDPTDLIRIDMSAVGQATGLSRYTVGDKVKDLAEWGAITKSVEKVKVEKKGKKIEVDHVSVALNPVALTAPEEIRPVKDGEEYDLNHGGKRERCRKCKSQNIRRIHHILCLNCGEEYISYDQQEHLQDALWVASSEADPAMLPKYEEIASSVSQDATRIASTTNSICESRCHSDIPEIAASVSQDATRMHTPVEASVRQPAPPINTISLSPSLEESFSDAEADFWTRWRALTGETKLNETAFKHIQELACITTTQDLQSLYDFAYSRLEEFAKAQNKKAVPPRLGNLTKCLPEWKQTQKRRDQEQTNKEQAQEHVISGTGRLENWTQKRLKGLENAPPLVYYERLDTPAKPKGGANGLNKPTFGDLPKRQPKIVEGSVSQVAPQNDEEA